MLKKPERVDERDMNDTVGERSTYKGVAPFLYLSPSHVHSSLVASLLVFLSFSLPLTQSNTHALRSNTYLRRYTRTIPRVTNARTHGYALYARVSLSRTHTSASHTHTHTSP